MIGISVAGVVIALLAWLHPFSPAGGPNTDTTTLPVVSSPATMESPPVSAPKPQPAVSQTLTRYLSEGDHIDETFFIKKGPLDINGVTYPNTVIGDLVADTGQPYTEAVFLLSRKCTRFQATVGASDKNAYTGRTVFTVLGDGEAVLYRQILHFGASENIDVSVQGHLRLSLRMAGVDDVGYYNQLVGYGDARITCTSAPESTPVN